MPPRGAAAAPPVVARRRFVPGARRRIGALPALTEGQPAKDVRSREGVYRRALGCADALAAFVSLTVVLWIAGPNVVNGLTLIAMPLIVAVNKLARLYDRDDLVLRKSTLDEAPVLLQLAGLYALLVWLVHDALTSVELRPAHVVLLWGLCFGLLVLGRAAARRVARTVAATERCLVLGDPSAAALLERKLSEGRARVEVVASKPLPMRVNGGAPEWLTEPGFRALVRENDVHRVIIAPATTDCADTLDLIRLAKAVGVRVSVLPRLFEVVGSAVEFEQIDGLTMLGVRRFGLTRSSRMLKRAFDVVGVSAVLVVTAPLMAAIAIWIALDSKGPVFFRQVRVGRDGRRFRIFKFRTMCCDAEDRKAELRHLNETSGLFKIADDPRVTRAGRFLRRTSLDELPQLFNVLRGEMSMVGPRPLVVDEDEQIVGLLRSRLHLTPGMTGHWQILGAARIPMEEMVGIDYLYVANWSLWTDVKILLRTVPYMLSRGSM